MRPFELGGGRFLGSIDLNRNTIKNIGNLLIMGATKEYISIGSSYINSYNLTNPLTIATDGKSINTQIKNRKVLELSYDALLDGQSDGNYLRACNSKTDAYPKIYAEGGGTNIGIQLVNKGTGIMTVNRAGSNSWIGMSTGSDDGNGIISTGGTAAVVNLKLSTKAGTIYTDDSTIQGQRDTAPSFNSPGCNAASYNHVLTAYNDIVGGMTLSIYSTGSTWAGAEGTSSTVIRNNIGPLLLGHTNYAQVLEGTVIRIKPSFANAQGVWITKNNPVISGSSYSTGTMTLETSDGSNPSIGFHRSGYDAIVLYETATAGVGTQLRLIENGGIDAMVLTSRNYERATGVAGGFTLDESFNGCVIYQLNNGAKTVYVPSGLSPNFRCSYIENSTAGSTTVFAGSGSAVLYNVDGVYTCSKPWGMIDIRYVNNFTNVVLLTGRMS